MSKEYEITITSVEPNPHYVPPPTRTMYDGYQDDTREPHQRAYDIRRVLSVTLTQDEYDRVRMALMSLWGLETAGSVVVFDRQP